jgi:SAM-dependent methyltransferase
MPSSTSVDRLMADLELQPGAVVLDAGCGAGRWVVALAERGARVAGIDLSPRMIAQADTLARERGLAPETAHVEVGSIERLPFPDASFDATVCLNVLDFTPSPGDALLEFARVLVPGGRLAVSTLGARSPVKAAAWQRFLPEGMVSGFPVPANEILPWETEALLEALGFEILEHRPDFGPAASGARNPYTAEQAELLGDRVLRQTVATAWTFIARHA